MGSEQEIAARAAGAGGAKGTAAAAEEAPLAAAACTHVATYFSSIKPFYSNLLEDLGATDTFVIDGDCLLLELCSGSRLDWSSGGQFLQLRGALERHFQDLARANTTGVRYWVVFFDSNQALMPDPAARLARLLAQRWLPHALGIPVLLFSSWWDAHWLGWLSATRPSMLFLTDLPTGAASLEEAGSPGGHAAAGGASEEPAVSARHYLQAYTVHTVVGGTQAAFLREQRFTENFVFAFCTGWRSIDQPGGAAIRAAATAVGSVFCRQAAKAQAASPAAGSDFAVATNQLCSIPTLEALCGAAGSLAPGGSSICNSKRCTHMRVRLSGTLPLKFPVASSASGLHTMPWAAFLQAAVLHLLPGLASPGSPPAGRARALLGACGCGIVPQLAPAGGSSPLLPLFERAGCLHELLLRELPLMQRALQLPAAPSSGPATGGLGWEEVQQTLRGFIASMHKVAAALLAGTRVAPARRAWLSARTPAWQTGWTAGCCTAWLPGSRWGCHMSPLLASRPPCASCSGSWLLPARRSAQATAAAGQGWPWSWSWAMHWPPTSQQDQGERRRRQSQRVMQSRQ